LLAIDSKAVAVPVANSLFSLFVGWSRGSEAQLFGVQSMNLVLNLNSAPACAGSKGATVARTGGGAR
jgi:hypothetical protein